MLKILELSYLHRKKLYEIGSRTWAWSEDIDRHMEREEEDLCKNIGTDKDERGTENIGTEEDK